MPSVRVRFAPAPSGELHVGSARTALFNWLFARHHGGAFILRIEDTDPERAREEYVTSVLEALRWLGLDWDEGPEVGGPHAPYRQSERAEIHREALAKLEASGHAYRCWCTREEIAARGVRAGYDRYCRSRTKPGEGPYVLRFAVPLEGEDVVIEDVILGEHRTRLADMQDFVIARSDGSATYRIAAAYDDLLMGITHVIRGQDLLAAAAEQTLLLRALGARPPVFAHLPLILGPDRSKLSKRHGSISIQSLRAAGFVPEAVVNYLALLGWSSPSGEELLPVERIVAEFRLEDVKASPAVYDLDKLRWMSSEYLKALPAAEWVRRVAELDPDVPRDLLSRVLELGMIQTRAATLGEVPGLIAYLHRRLPPDPLAAERWLTGRGELLRAAAERLAAVEPWSREGIEEAIQGTIAAFGLDRRRGTKPFYVAISGREAALPLYESIWILGREEAVARLRAAAETGTGAPVSKEIGDGSSKAGEG